VRTHSARSNSKTILSLTRKTSSHICAAATRPSSRSCTCRSSWRSSTGAGENTLVAINRLIVSARMTGCFGSGFHNRVAWPIASPAESNMSAHAASFVAAFSSDFFPSAPPATVDWSQDPVQLPTIPGQLQTMEASVEHIITKLNQMPMKEIAESLQKTMGDLDLTLVSARGTIDSAGTMVRPNSPQAQQLDSTLEEVRRAARSVRVLADYLDRHPEALIRGKKGEAK